MKISLGQLGIPRLSSALRRFGKWWLKELLDLFPVRIVEILSGRGQALLVVAVDQQSNALELLSGAGAPIATGRISIEDNTLAEIDRFLRSHNLDRKQANIGLRLAAESGFFRQFRLPAEAADAIDAIVADDLAKKTPFKIEDIFSGYTTIEDADGAKVTVWQWVVRRQYVRQALSRLKIDIEHLAFVVFEGSFTDQPTPFINLRPSAFADNSWHRKTTSMLGCSAVILALLAGSLKYYYQQTALDRLDEQIRTTSGKAQQVRTLVNQLQERKNTVLHLRLERSEAPGLIDLWEETARILPSHSWLTEFRFSEVAGKHEVGMFGFSSAAPSLVTIFDNSPLFLDAALTSAVVFDAAEGRERFALQAKVKASEAFREASR
jgi:general secretion pathway protein L